MSNRKHIPKKTREAVYQKYNGHCAYCGQEISINEMRIDHRVPLYNGGTDDVNNYMPACTQCNYYKDTMTLDSFRENLELIPRRLHDQMFIFRLAEKYGRFTTERQPIEFYFETVEKREGKNG